MTKDYYEILGVEKNSTSETIKKAYRKKAMEFHPDKNPGDSDAEEKFKEAAQAYEILSNEEKKASYDRGGRVPHDPMGGMNYSDISDIFSVFGDQDWSSVFDSIYGNQSNGIGRDYAAQIPITLQEAYYGTSRQISIDDNILDITINRGIRNGQRVVFRGMGEKGSRKNGNFLVDITIIPDANIIRREDDLYIEKYIDVFTAILGGNLEVDTFEGIIGVTVPKGIQNGHNLRIKGRGMPVYTMKEGFGDLYIKLNVLMPDKLTPEQERLFKQIKDLK